MAGDAVARDLARGGWRIIKLFNDRLAHLRFKRRSLLITRFFADKPLLSEAIWPSN